MSDFSTKIKDAQQQIVVAKARKLNKASEVDKVLAKAHMEAELIHDLPGFVRQPGYCHCGEELIPRFVAPLDLMLVKTFESVQDRKVSDMMCPKCFSRFVIFSELD